MNEHSVLNIGQNTSSDDDRNPSSIKPLDRRKGFQDFSISIDVKEEEKQEDGALNNMEEEKLQQRFLAAESDPPIIEIPHTVITEMQESVEESAQITEEYDIHQGSPQDKLFNTKESHRNLVEEFKNNTVQDSQAEFKQMTEEPVIIQKEVTKEMELEIEKRIRSMKILDYSEDYDDPFSSNTAHFITLALSILFFVLVITEFGGGISASSKGNFSSQQQVQSLMSSLYDYGPAFDSQGRTRMDIDQPSQLLSYFQTGLMPYLFNEPFKAARLTPFLPAFLQINLYTNETVHYINCGLNYLVGLKIIRQKALWVNNTNAKNSQVLPQLLVGPEPNSGNQTIVILGISTYRQAMNKVLWMNSSGWFDDQTTYSISVELLTFNSNLNNGGFYTFLHIKDQKTGAFNTSQGIFQTIYPTTYDDFSNVTVILRIVFFALFTFCFGLSFVRFIFFETLYYVNIFRVQKEWRMPWYYYLDIIDFVLTGYSLFYWFKNLSQRGSFSLPFATEESYLAWTQESASYISNFLVIAPISMFFKCVKLLQMFSQYFPAFGVLFESIRSARDSAASFFLMTGVLALGLSVLGTLCFGSQLEGYSTFGQSLMSVFYIMMSDPTPVYDSLLAVNPNIAPLYYFPCAFIFQIILLYLFLSLVIRTYDALRKDRQLQSEAIAKILFKNYQWKAHLVVNLLFCRIDRRNKQEYESGQADITYQGNLIQDNLNTIFMFNITNLLSRRGNMQTKENYEVQLKDTMRSILREQKFNTLKRLDWFKSAGNHSEVNKELGKSVFFLLYIVLFATMILLQLDITSTSSASMPIRAFMEGGPNGLGSVQGSKSQSSRLLVNEEFENKQKQHRNLEFTSSTNFDTNLYQINSVDEMHQWLYFKFYRYLYASGQGPNVFISQNYFVGLNRMRMTFRKMVANSTFGFMQPERLGSQFSSLSDSPQWNEISGNFTGKSSKLNYTYYPAQSLKTYTMTGGYVVMLQNVSSTSFSLIGKMYNDKIFDLGLATLVIEIATFNPNYQMIILTSVVFECPNSGVIVPSSSSRSIRLNFYDFSNNYTDRIRVLFEAIFVLFVLIQDLKRLNWFMKRWVKVYAQDLAMQNQGGIPLDKSCIEWYYYHLGFDRQKLKKNLPLLTFLVIHLYNWIKWAIRAVIRTIRVAILFLNRDLFKLMHIAMIVLSNVMIVVWSRIIILQRVTYDDNGYVLSGPDDNKLFLQLFDFEVGLTQLDIYSEISRELKLYTLLSAVCGVFTFWRIFQFFQFSLQLSSFAEVLRSSYRDIVYFLIMFTMFIGGFGVMATAFFGENEAAYSTIPSSILQLLRLMFTAFGNHDFQDGTVGRTLFFISFMVLFFMLLLNILTAIIIVHYVEQRQLMKEIESSFTHEQRRMQANFATLVIRFLLTSLAPPTLKDNRLFGWWFTIIDKVDRCIFYKEINKLEIAQAIEQQIEKDRINRQKHTLSKMYQKQHKIQQKEKQ